MTEPAPTNNPPPPPLVPAKSNAKALWSFTILLLIVGLAWLAYWFLYLQYHEYTDDANANGNMISINASVPGSVIAFYADDTNLVEQGQLLVELDPTDYRIRYENELAVLASVVLQVKQLYANVKANEANVESKKAVVERTSFDYENRLRLVDSQAVSNEDYVRARSEYLVAALGLDQAQQQLQMAKDAVGYSPIESHPLIEEQKAKVRAAYINLQHTSIYAPAKGYVAQRTVEVGQWATPTTRLLAVIPAEGVWVDANYKETQLKYMRIGQPATVKFDLYGSEVTFQGTVLGIASGTGSVFSLIPPQNATGNWIKIVQRLPVRVSLDPELVKEYPIRVGLSAEVTVDITDQTLPRLATSPSTNAVGKTSVFNLDLAPVDEAISEILEHNLHAPPESV